MKGELSQLKTKVSSDSATITELQNRNKELEAQVGDDTREALKAKIDAYEQQQMIDNLESSSAYVEAITKPLDEISDQAVSIAEKYSVNADTLIDVMAMSDEAKQAEALSEILVDATDRDKARVYNLIDEVPKILSRRQELRDNVDQATKEAELLKEQVDKQQLADSVERRGNITRNVVDRMTEKLPFLAAMSGVNLDSIKSTVSEADVSAMSGTQQAYLAVSGQLLPGFISEQVRLQKQVDHLTKELAEYDSADPKITPKTTTNAPNTPGATTAGGSTMSFLDSVEQNIAAG